MRMRIWIMRRRVGGGKRRERGGQMTDFVCMEMTQKSICELWVCILKTLRNTKNVIHSVHTTTWNQSWWTCETQVSGRSDWVEIFREAPNGRRSEAPNGRRLVWIQELWSQASGHVYDFEQSIIIDISFTKSSPIGRRHCSVCDSPIGGFRVSEGWFLWCFGLQ